MHKIKNRKTFLLGTILLILSSALFFYSYTLFTIVASILLVYLFLGRKLSNNYVDSKFSLLLISVFTYVGLLCLAILISSAFIEVKLNLVTILTGLILLVTVIYQKRRENTPLYKRVVVNFHDILSLSVATVSILLIGLLPLVNSGVLQQHSNILLTITGNVDNGPHLAIFNDYIDTGTNRIWSDAHTTRSDPGGFYPTSWHGANAGIAKAFVPNLEAGIETIVAYSILFIFWVGVFILLSVRLTLSIFQDLQKKPKGVSPNAYLIMSLLLLVAVYLFSIHLLRFGFFSFVPQLIAVLALIYPLRQFAEDGFNKNGMVGLAAIYTAISLATWVLLLPVIGLAVIISVLLVAQHSKKKGVLNELNGSWILGSVAIIGIFAQLWLIISVESSGKVSFLEGMMLDGGVPIYDPIVYIVLFSGLIGAILLVKKRSKVYLPVTVIIASTVAFCAFMYVLQSFYTGSTHYYFYKSLLILPAVLVPVGVATMGIIINKMSKTYKDLAIISSIAIPLLFLLFIPSDKGMFSYINGSRSVSANANSRIIHETATTPYPSNNVTIFLIGTNESSDIASLLVQANRPQNACFDDLRLSQIITKITQTAVTELDSYILPDSCSSKQVKFVVGEEYESLLETKDSSNFTVEVLPQ